MSRGDYFTDRRRAYWFTVLIVGCYHSLGVGGGEAAPTLYEVGANIRLTLRKVEW